MRTKVIKRGSGRLQWLCRTFAHWERPLLGGDICDHMVKCRFCGRIQRRWIEWPAPPRPLKSPSVTFSDGGPLPPDQVFYVGETRTFPPDEVLRIFEVPADEVGVAPV